MTAPSPLRDRIAKVATKPEPKWQPAWLANCKAKELAR